MEVSKKLKIELPYDPATHLVGMQIKIATIENSMEVSKKLKIELPYDLATHSWG